MGWSSTANIIRLIDTESPERVLMDANLGERGGICYNPLQEVANFMESKRYNLQVALLGVTGKSELLDKIKAESNLPVADKVIDKNIVNSFLS